MYTNKGIPFQITTSQCKDIKHDMYIEILWLSKLFLKIIAMISISLWLNIFLWSMQGEHPLGSTRASNLPAGLTPITRCGSPWRSPGPVAVCFATGFLGIGISSAVETNSHMSGFEPPCQKQNEPLWLHVGLMLLVGSYDLGRGLSMLINYSNWRINMIIMSTRYNMIHVHIWPMMSNQRKSWAYEAIPGAGVQPLVFDAWNGFCVASRGILRHTVTHTVHMQTHAQISYIIKYRYIYTVQAISYK